MDVSSAVHFARLCTIAARISSNCLAKDTEPVKQSNTKHKVNKRKNSLGDFLIMLWASVLLSGVLFPKGQSIVLSRDEASSGERANTVAGCRDTVHLSTLNSVSHLSLNGIDEYHISA